jgi:DNA polymerase elongation subunit (family B)
MLREIIDTRLMVKRAIKTHSDDDCILLRRSLEARQLAIKLLGIYLSIYLLSNVTYGYSTTYLSI